MNIKIYRIVIAFALLFFMSGSAYTMQSENPLSDITVGSKTSDSTGVVSISNASIQSSIISTIPSFNGYQITSNNTSLLVGDSVCYLVMKVRGASGDTLNVAIQLRKNGSTNLFFRQHGLDEVHTSQSIGTCPACKFMRHKYKILVGSACIIPNFMTPYSNSGCDDKVSKAE